MGWEGARGDRCRCLLPGLRLVRLSYLFRLLRPGPGAALPQVLVVTQPPFQEAGDDLHQIFRLLRTATGVDFTYYKPNTIRRRIERRMAVHRIHTLAQYTRYLRDRPDGAGAERTLRGDVHRLAQS